MSKGNIGIDTKSLWYCVKDSVDGGNPDAWKKLLDLPGGE